jgi:hypothetical protein
VDRTELDLPSDGPVSAHLSDLSGAIGSSLDLRVRPSPPGGRLLDGALVLLAAAALAAGFAGGRRGAHGQFGAVVAGSVAFAVYLHRRFSPGDPLASVIAALMVSVLLGGALAVVMGLALRSAGSR